MADIVADGINGAWLEVMNSLNKKGIEQSPRGKANKEILDMSVEIKNPKKRILSLPIRKTSLPFAFGELMWYLSGRNDLYMMSYYSKNMKNFSDDGKTLNSAYGYRIFGHHNAINFNQWEDVVNRLSRDSETRQAIIHLHTPNNKPTNDEVCTLTLQFLIRDGKLDMKTNMRSNDIIWGFTYDVFSFTTFQELIANELGVEVGTYYHNVASMHIYEKDYNLLDTVDAFYNQLNYITEYDKEFSYDGLTLYDNQLYNLFELESDMRTSLREEDIYTMGNNALRTMADVFYLYNLYKTSGKRVLFSELKYDNFYHNMLRNQLSGYNFNDSSLQIVEGNDGSGKTTYIEKIDKDPDLTQVISFSKPGDNFDKAIYFQYAFMTGDIILDRFIFSEIVYSKHFNRGCMLSDDDVAMIEDTLIKRGEEVKFLDTDPSVCYKRLDEDDKKIFSKEDIENISYLYRETLENM